MGLIFQLILFIGIIYLFVKFKAKAKAILDGVASRTKVDYTPETRSYSPAAVVMEHTRFKAFPATGIYGQYIKVRWPSIHAVLVAGSGSGRQVTVLDIIDALTKSDLSPEVVAIAKPFFYEYEQLNIRMPLDEFLFAIKGGLDVH